jgi:hypothetical protein
MSDNESQRFGLSVVGRAGVGSLSLTGDRPAIFIKLIGVAIGIAFLSGEPAFGWESFHAGPILDRHKLVVPPGRETEALGPFYYERAHEMAETWALPPIFSSTEWLDGEGHEYDLPYPFLTYDRYGGEYRWQFCQILNFAGGYDQQGVARHRFSLFPIYFQQRSADSNGNYTALFPIAGHLENRFFRSEIDFVLWPLYVKTVRRPSAGPAGEDPSLAAIYQLFEARRGDVTTRNYLYPFFHVRRGEGLFGWQAWPLAGHEEKAITTRTNNWGDIETVAGHEKLTVLWPIFTKLERNLGTPNPEREWIFVPFYQQSRSPARDSTSYLTPFGLTLTEDRARKYREVDAPWPFIVFAWGEGKTTRRVWPLFSQASSENLERNSYLWPIYTYRRSQGPTLDRDRHRICYFLYSHTREKNTETGKAKTRTDFWPLFTHQRNFDGSRRLQILALLEPFAPANKSIERNYSPLWSLWRSAHNPQAGTHSQSLLWNLYRREVAPESRKNSLLFGLFQYQSTADSREWRLFYLPIRTAAKKTEHAPEHR